MRRNRLWIITTLITIGITTDCYVNSLNTNGVFYNSQALNEQKDLSQYNNQILPNTNFYSEPNDLSLLRILVENGWISSDTVNQITISNIGIGGNQFLLTAKSWSTNYKNSAIILYTYASQVSLSDFLGDSYTLYNDPTTSPWTVFPSMVDFLLAIKSKTENLDLNQIDIQNIKMENIEFDVSKNLYFLTINALPNSLIYYGSANIYFALDEKTVTLLGLNFKFANNVSAIPTISDNVITLNYDGEYNITDDGTGISNRSINIPDNYVNTSINLVGDQINIKPTSGASAITLGENVNLSLMINAPTLNMQGAPGYAGIRVPYSSSITFNGSSSITCIGGYTTTTAGAGIGGVSTTASGTIDDNSEKNCGTVNIFGTVSIKASGQCSSKGDTGGASAGIGGAGCLYGYGGKCKSVVIDTTGTIETKGGGWNGTGYVYCGSAPGIGGGNVGNYNVNAKYGGNLENFELRNGTVIAANGDSNNLSIGSGSVIGGGSVATGNTSSGTYIGIAGSLLNFKMSGGNLVLKENTGSYFYFMRGALIGGGGVYKTQTGTPTNDSQFISGNLDNFIMNGGNIYLIRSNNETSAASEKLPCQTIGTGNICFSNMPSTGYFASGTMTNFDVTGGSLMMNKAYSVLKTPTNDSNVNVYPCYVPRVINDNVTSGYELTIPSINYHTNLLDYSEYGEIYSGVVHLPIGNYTDIIINGITYRANVTNITSPTATNNIVY